MKRMLPVVIGVVVLIAVAWALWPTPAPARPTLTRILFIYGSVPPGTDLNDMIRITNTGRNGYSQLADMLQAEQGHNVTELNDLDPLINPLRDSYLNLYDLVVFGSNNRRYASQEAGYLNLFVQNGGSVLALSDSRFGLSPDRDNDVPGAGELSDNDLIGQYGMEIHHDNYTVVDADASRFVTTTHPILAGLKSFRGEGVSLIRRTGPPAQILVRGNGLPLTNGQITGNDYAITMIASVGRGRVAAVFDRNTWFNAGVGSDGTDLDQLDNRDYARNVFDWLIRLKFRNQ